MEVFSSLKKTIPRGYERASAVGTIGRILTIYGVYAAIVLSNEGNLSIQGYNFFQCKGGELFSKAFSDMDFDCLIFILRLLLFGFIVSDPRMFSATVCSYAFKLAVRINMQIWCCYIPAILSTFLAYIFSDSNPTNVCKYLPSYILAILPLVLLTTHLFNDDYGLYQLG